MVLKSLIAVAALCLSLLIYPPTVAAADTTIGDSGLLRLVNREDMLSPGYRPTNLVAYKGILLHGEAREAFVQMLEAMKLDGISGLKLQSAYREYSYQQAIYNTRVKELRAKGYSKIEAESKAAQSIQPPGASEHQLGLALDVSTDGKLTQAFGETLQGQWLAEHCHKFGFIIRYPSTKTDVTQIVYEPWHLRYVGMPHATVITDLGLTLEEYVDYIKQVKKYICWGTSGEYYLFIYNCHFPCVLPEGTIDISSLTGAQYVITMRKVYPNPW